MISQHWSGNETRSENETDIQHWSGYETDIQHWSGYVTREMPNGGPTYDHTIRVELCLLHCNVLTRNTEAQFIVVGHVYSFHGNLEHKSAAPMSPVYYTHRATGHSLSS